jgi:hypothetical protein
MNPRDEGEGWVGVDLDGCLAFYDGYKGDDHVGEPIMPMVERVKQWIAEGRDVRIFTARKPHPAIRKFCHDNLGKILPITNIKDRHMQLLIDDRAVGVRRNTGELFSEENLKQMFEEE